MSKFYKRFENFFYDRKIIQKAYFDQIHPYVVKLDTPEVKRFNHLATPGIGMDLIRKMDEGIFQNLKIIFDKISKTFNVPSGFAGGFFMVPPGLSGTIHIDTLKGIGNIRQWAFNIPVYNTDNNYQEWFKLLAPCEPIWVNRALWFETDQVETIESITVDVPTMVKVDIPHRVTNPTDDYRVILSVRSEANNLTYDDVSKIF